METSLCAPSQFPPLFLTQVGTIAYHNWSTTFQPKSLALHVAKQAPTEIEKSGRRLIATDSTYSSRNIPVGKPLENARRNRALDLIFQRVRILQWLPKYSKSDIVADLIAGITVGLTMMPQSIAYANLAGLPAQYGLYTAFIGSFTYIFFGTIKEVSIGPTSLMALLTFSYCENLPIEFVVLLTFFVGCVEFLMGILKLGFLVDFISPCVTSGFTSAMSVTIVTSQLKNLLGLTKLKNHGIFDVWIKIFQRRGDISLADTFLSAICIVFLMTLKQFPKIRTDSPLLRKTLWFLSISKNALIVLITSLVAFYYETSGGAPFLLSGAVPQGFPQVRLPPFAAQIGNETVSFFEMTATLGSGILVLPIAAVLANVAIAKAFSSGMVVDATQEMMTLGLCNVFGSFIQAMPSCGAFTRSAVASSSGVRTPLQGIYSGTIIILALSFLTPYFYFIPRATLGAVLTTAIISMFDYAIFPKLWKCNKFDFVLTLSTLVIGVVFGVEIGIIAGGFMNLLILMKVWARPRILSEIRTSDSGKEYIYVKPELGLYYPAIDYLTTVVAEAHSVAPELRIVIDCSMVLRLDYAGCQAIENMIKVYNKKKQMLTLQDLRPEINKQLMVTVSGIEIERNKWSFNPETPLLVEKIPEVERKLSYYDNV